MIFGLSYTEFVALIASLVTLIITISVAGKPSSDSEAISHLIDPLNKQIQKLESRCLEKDILLKESSEMRLVWRQLLRRELGDIIDDLEELRQSYQEDED